MVTNPRLDGSDTGDRDSGGPGHAVLSEPAEDFLFEYGAMPTPDPATAARARRAQDASLSSAMARLLNETVTSSQFADLLGLSPDTVRAHKRRGAAYAFSWEGKDRYPRWQLTPSGSGFALVPHLPAVLAALPDACHPLDVTDFFTRPGPLLVRGRPTSVVDWLNSGGAVDPVLDLADGRGVLG